ncbi:hypothetical protein [Paraburkholderia sp. Cpub6]|uniref:hypothetical protein n=1 Tax=Paraburkholderia sp. Cpub6 TaxID=2723094 RepID=UPI00161CB211|nr:hypothetical protein [Paraburkholderia sp. Cpub6]MBB5463787.1 hypothetical protein [Paraburkholderia sp. Cpub6]
MSKFYPRAAVAYINVEKRAGRVADQPSEAHSFERSLVEKDYMVLRNASPCWPSIVSGATTIR